MPFSRSASHARRPFGTLVILLALIGWGLQYKTSLYYHPFQTSSAPPAKLLSEAERPSPPQRINLSSVTTKVQVRTVIHCAWAVQVNRWAVRDAGDLVTARHSVASPVYRTRTWFLLRAPPLS
jgi:hypothetical protein